MKKRSIIVMLLLIALIIPYIHQLPQKSEAASKPKLSETRIEKGGNGDSKEGRIAIKNLKAKDVKKITVKSSSKKIVAWVEKGKTAIGFFVNDKATATITVKLELKNKKKYTLKAKIIALREESNWYVEYVANQGFIYNSENKEFRAIFSLLDYYKEYTPGKGNVKINIKNDDGQVVYENSLEFNWADFEKWPYDYDCCCFRIPISDIKEGTSSSGTATMKVNLSDGRSFDASEFSVEDLPMVSGDSLIKIQLPSLPLTLNDYRGDNKINYTYVLNKIDYKVGDIIDGKCSVKLLFSGKKTYDYRGNGQSSSCCIGYKLYKAGSNSVVYSDEAYTPDVDVNDTFDNVEENIYDLEPGEYRLEILSTN